MVEKKQESTEAKKDKYFLLTIATQTAEVIKDNDTEEQIDPNKALLMILNDLQLIKKSLI